MNVAAHLLGELRGHGGAAEADGSALRLRPATRLPPDLLAELRANKAEVVALLAPNDATIWRLPPATPEQSAEEAADRAAIAAETLLPDPGTAERAEVERRHGEAVAGLLLAGLQRHPSWPGADCRPTPGCWCSCCRGRNGWRAAKAATGWRCTACHPPEHLPAHALVIASPSQTMPNPLERHQHLLHQKERHAPLYPSTEAKFPRSPPSAQGSA